MNGLTEGFNLNLSELSPHQRKSLQKPPFLEGLATHIRPWLLQKFTNTVSMFFLGAVDGLCVLVLAGDMPEGRHCVPAETTAGSRRGRSERCQCAVQINCTILPTPSRQILK